MAFLYQPEIPEPLERVVQVYQDVIEITDYLVLITVSYLRDFRCHDGKTSKYLRSNISPMTDTQAETVSLNGTGPAPDPPCEDCASSGEKALAVVAVLFGLFIIAMAVDMFTGGKVGGFVRERVPQ